MIFLSGFVELDPEQSQEEAKAQREREEAEQLETAYREIASWFRH